MSEIQSEDLQSSASGATPAMTTGELWELLRSRLKLLVIGPLAAGLLALGVTYLIAPTFTAVATFLPPQQSQSAVTSALASLGSLAGLAGGAAGARTPGEQYVALMQSISVADRIVDQFKLMEIYNTDYRVDARKKLAKNVRIALGRKDGLITVEVEDKSPQRAADMANRYVDELRRITGTLAVTEAQQRRAFFDRQLQQTRDKLVLAQQALQASGFNGGALKAEPRSAAEGYAKLKASVVVAEVRLQVLRGTLTESTPEIRQQQASLTALREQLALVEQAADTPGGSDYIDKYRTFKYEEALFELYARQFELARVDESREGALIQVVDAATPPEKKTRPQRALTAAVVTLVSFVLIIAFLIARHRRRDGSHSLPHGST